MAAPDSSVAAIKAGCGPFIGATGPEEIARNAEVGAELSMAAVAALPSLRALVDAESVALADRTAAAEAIATLLERGRSSAEVVRLLTTAPGVGSESLCAGGWVTYTKYMCDTVGG